MMQTVVCISIRESMPDQIKVGIKYKIDLTVAYGDNDGDWYAPVYSMDGERISEMNLKHFRSE